ncbi:MAG: moeA [Caulobacteraceae bacterium]|nr:moeA [Caulobacteraceae bacterium]
MKNLPVDEARAIMLAHVEPLAQESVSLFEADGRVLGEMVDALRPHPPFTASAMDGWAVRDLDVTGPGVRLTIVGESAAGRPFDGEVGPGEAVRIFTGAPMPVGADAVVIQEEAERDGDQVTIKVGPAPHANVRPMGGDFRTGDQLLAPGVRLDPWRIGLAAAAGRAELRVRRRPRVAILSTGEEIVPAGAEPSPFQIYDSGTPALASLVRGWGGEAARLKPARDDKAAIVEAVRGEACDLIVTIGGASVGDYDLVKPALAELGLELKVESLKMRPGKPTWFGVLADGRRVLGLPGNPASALACAQLFLRSLVLASQGADPALRLIQAVLAKPAPANGPREHWMRARLSHDGPTLVAEPMGDQDSSLVKVFADADALLRRPPDAPHAEAGTMVEVLPLERLR